MQWWSPWRQTAQLPELLGDPNVLTCKMGVLIPTWYYGSNNTYLAVLLWGLNEVIHL